MSATRVWKLFTALRAAGPYVLIELLLPGGTLLALLLWLSQRLRRGGFGAMQQFLADRAGNKTVIAAKPHRTDRAAHPSSLGVAVH